MLCALETQFNPITQLRMCLLDVSFTFEFLATTLYPSDLSSFYRRHVNIQLCLASYFFSLYYQILFSTLSILAQSSLFTQIEANFLTH